MALALDRLFAEGMILQRGKVVRVWGTAGPGQAVELEIQGLVIELASELLGDVRIRFAQTNWYRINLYNSAHIPALPFEVAC